MTSEVNPWTEIKNFASQCGIQYYSHDEVY